MYETILTAFMQTLIMVFTSTLIAVILGSVFIGRCFCRYLCPLGAFYALFNRFALYRMQVSEQTCIRCGKCKAACPTQAITSGFLCQSNQQKGNEHGTKS